VAFGWGNEIEWNNFVQFFKTEWLHSIFDSENGAASFFLLGSWNWSEEMFNIVKKLAHTSVAQIGGAHILEREEKTKAAIADGRLGAIRLPASSCPSSSRYRKFPRCSACPVCSNAPSYTKVLTCSMLFVKIGADWAIASSVRPRTSCLAHTTGRDARGR
jgi:hypothetical protein